jgi:hypothetical protein
MIAYDVKQIRSGHISERLVQEFAAKASAGLGDGRFEQAHVTYRRISAVLFDGAAMQLEHAPEAEKVRMHRHSARRLNIRP